MNVFEYFTEEIKDEGIGFFSIMAWVIGSVLPVFVLKPKTRGDVIMMILSGFASAMFFGVGISNYLGLVGQSAAAVQFGVALGGMFIIKGILLIYQEFAKKPFVTLWKLISMYMNSKNDNDDTEIEIPTSDDDSLDEKTL